MATYDDATCKKAYDEVEGNPNPNPAQVGIAIACIRQELPKIEKAAKKAGQGFTSFNKRVGESGQLMKDFKDALFGVASHLRDFATDQQAQYQLSERLAESYKKTARSMGLSVGAQKDFSKEFKGAVALVAEYGGEISDVQEIVDSFADTSGRVRILGKEEVKNIWQLKDATQAYGTTIPELYEALDLMGVSNEDATKRMLGLIRDSEKIGLNSSKVVKVLAQNMKNMQSYSFAGGVKGMTEMAKLGVKLRMDVSSMLSMADKFYQPEAAIEAAANLQMLGGDIAEAFGDPFETMYLARNKPEELAERLQGMTENMMTFNEETGEYEFPAEVRMQLKAAGEQLGINTDQMIEMARQTSKMKDVKDKLSMSGMFSEEEMEGISSMARLEDGEFVVDVRDEEGKKVAKSIDELTQGDLSMMITSPADEKEYMSDMLYESKTTNEHLANMVKSGEFAIVEDIDVYKVMEETTNDSMRSMKEAVTEGMQKMVDNLKDSNLAEIVKNMGADAATIDTQLSQMIDDIKVGFATPLKLGEDSPLEIDSTGKIIIQPKNPITTDQDALNIYGNEEEQDFMLRSTGKVTSFSSEDDVIGAKDGGPLDRLLRSGLGGNSGNISVDPMTLTINGNLSVTMPDGATERVNMDTIKPQIVNLIKSHLNGMAYNGNKPAGNADGADMVLNS
jgi:hypothetical protein